MLFADRTIEATEADEEAMVSKTTCIVGGVVSMDDKAGEERMPASLAAAGTPARPATTDRRR
ncbi:hypothetical protein CKO45_17015 [Paracraurococcus ruber]|uniref:Uncharacterized protein n=2 Tax=Paracraurococcus ruber TaxID=77675 RepID=A0ABS1CZH0_9PROT|nr:hypothetical protein [Paracraurococcus ruber]